MPEMSSQNMMSSPSRTRTPRRNGGTVDPLAMDEGGERMDEDGQDEMNRPKRPRARNLINNDVIQVRDSSGEALVLLMEQFISE